MRGKKVEVVALHELLRFHHTGNERLPRDHRCDGGKGNLATLTRLQQGSANLTVETSLVVDRLASLLELLLMLVLGAVEEPADDLVMQVDDLVDDRGRRIPRWHVERTFAWFGQCRLLAKEYGRPSPLPRRGSGAR